MLNNAYLSQSVHVAINKYRSGEKLMIPLDILDYENMKLDLEITEYVNKNIEGVIRVLLDYIEDDPDYEIDFFFPRDYYERKPYECKRNIYELYEVIKSSVLRDYIKPKYEYLLFAILQWWEDVSDFEEDLLIHQLDCSLKDKIIMEYPEEESKYIIDAVCNFEEYEYICLDDHDFLPHQLNELVTIYLRNPLIVKRFFQYDDLDDFIDLMDCDLRERYLEYRNQKQSQTTVNAENDIIRELINVLKSVQKRIVDYENKGETEITADIHDQLIRVLYIKHKIHISREYTMGRSIKKLGETDLYFYKEDNENIIEYAVLENKYIEKFSEQYNQLMGYLNPYFRFGITLSINRSKTLQEGIEFIKGRLTEFKGQPFEPIKIDRLNVDDNNFILFSEHVVPENGNKMTVYHLILQLNDKDRKDAALKARKIESK